MPRRVVDHTADRSLYKQLADILREDIQSGAYAPGKQLPSEPRLAQIHELNRETVRRAIEILRSEGLVTSVFGQGTYVREPRERKPVKLNPGDHVITRMPTPDERKELGIDEGVPIFVVTDASGNEMLHAGDVTMLQA